MKEQITVNTTQFKKWPEPVEIKVSFNLSDIVRKAKEELAKELCFEDCMSIAYALYDAGFAPAWSSDISDNIICGYGDAPFGFKYELLVKHTKDDGYEILPWLEVKDAMVRCSTEGEKQ